MKKIIAISLGIVLFLSQSLLLTTCAEYDFSSMTNEELIEFLSSAERELDIRKEEGPMVEQAIKALKEYWKAELQNREQLLSVDLDDNFEILKTRVLYICVPAESDQELARTVEGYFSDIYAIVEFVTLVDYWGTSPYYQIPNEGTTVAVYKDGRIVAEERAIIKAFQSNTFMYSYVNFIDSISDLGSEYNGIYNANE